MADSKITALTALTTADPATDMFPIVDVSDTTMAASGTTKRISINNILACSPTATLASATITGDLTVDTSTLKVDSANNRVGILTASPRSGFALDVLGQVALGDSTTSGSARLTIDGSGTAGNVPMIRFRSAGVQKALFGLSGGFFGDTSTDALIATDAAGAAIRFCVSDTGTEAMRLNSTGLGLGVSPSHKVHIYGSSPELVIQDSGANNSRLYTKVTNTAVFIGATYSSSAVPINFTLNGGASTAMQIDANSNVGVGVTPSAGRGAIQLSAGVGFPATQVASSDPNTLDDYEEGTFTPTIVGSTSAGTGTYTTNSGKYTKIGNVVTFQVYINWTAHTGTGNMRIGSLPFTNGNAFWAGSFGFIANIALTAGHVLTGYVEAVDSYVTLSQTPVGGGVASDVPIDTAGTIVFSASYTV
jgi:hypothetical protein